MQLLDDIGIAKAPPPLGWGQRLADRLRRTWQSWWPLRRKQIAPALPAPELAPSAEPPRPEIAFEIEEPQGRRTAVAYASDATGHGHYLTLGSVLDDIDHTFHILRKLRDVDPSAYAFNAKVGGRILPKTNDTWTRANWQRFLDELPMQGLVYSRDVVFEDEDRSTPAKGFRSAQYFTKVKPPRDVEALPTDIVYRLVGVVTGPARKRQKRELLDAWQCHVAVRDGRLVLLREWQTEMIKVPRSRRYRGADNREQNRVHARFLAHPKTLLRYVHCLNNEPWRQRDDVIVTPQAIAEFVFRDTVSAWMASRSGEFHVRVERGGLAAAFSVPRTVEFFRERRTGIASDGRRKRIFHSVVEHQRVLADGRTVLVPAHYRGERHFSWNDYSVAITAPTRMHIDVLAFDGAAIDEEEIELSERDDFLDAGEVGARLVAASENRQQV